VTGKSKFKSFCTLALCLAFLASFAVFISSPPVSASAPRIVGNPVLVKGANLIAAGESHSLALRGDGTVWAWGSNNVGQLGDGTDTERHTPVRVLGLENAVAVAAGNKHSLALRTDGTVWAWGYNGSGRLGDNTTTDENIPVRVLGMENAVAVACGSAHSLALRGDGTVWAWGNNWIGQLGDNTTTDRWTPVRVQGMENVVAVACGGDHSLALRADGTVWAWGWNFDGQLGDGTITERHTPVGVLGMENVVAVTGGSNHSLALRGDGTVWAWGWNEYGQLGDNTTTDRWTPVRVLGMENAVAIAADAHSLALRGDGTVWAWGYNWHGQLGDNTTTDRYTPVRVQGMENAVAVACGGDHSLALRADGTVWAWGWNEYGQLGDNTTTDRHTPVKVSDLPLPPCQVWFEWGETTGYGNSTTKQEKTAVGSFSAGLSGLTSWTTYHFRAVVQNSGGTSYGSGENFKTIENTPPDAPLNLSASPSDWTNTNSFTISWTNPPENSGVVDAYYKLDSAPTADNDGTLESGAGITSISGISVSGEGVHIIYVWLKDNAGNVDHNNRNSISLKLDASSPANPQVTSSTHPEGVSACNPSPSFSWAPVGGPSPVTFYYKLEGYDEDWQSTSGTGESYAGLHDGPCTFEVYAVDVGGTGEIDSYTFKVDTSAPSVQLSGTVKGRATATVGGWQLTTSDFTLTLSMTVSDISDVTVYVNGQSVPVVGGSFSKALTLAGGTNNFTIMVVDSAGNSTTRTLAVTQTVPAPPVAPPAGPASEMVLFVIVVIVLIISGAAVIFVFVKPPEK
jgi:alpha-tubulin suppressor-like RCC1 family protein